MKNGILWMVAMAVLCLGQAATAQPADGEDVARTVEALKMRVRDQDRRIAELESKQTAGSTQAAQREAIKEVIKEMNLDAEKRSALPGWLDDLKFGGDLRLRYQGECFNWGETDDSDKKTRHRARFRLRFGFTKTWLEDQIEVGFRLASGNGEKVYDQNGADPTSTNQTFDGNFSKKPVWIDLAYARYSPKEIKGLSIVGGKMKNPWMMNEIFLDTDVNPEGFWAEYKAPALGPVEPFAGAGYFILRESSSGHDTTMYGVQTGLSWQIVKDVKYTIAAYWHDYDHYDASGASARGNDSPLEEVPGFGLVGLTNSVDFKVLDLPVAVFFDWAHNCHEEDPADDYDNATDAYAAGVMVGRNKKKGDWSVKYRFARVEANALPGYFVDSDFGFANRQGHVIGATYNILDFLTCGVTVFLTEPIFSPTTTSGSSDFEDLTTTVQADLIWKF